MAHEHWMVGAAVTGFEIYFAIGLVYKFLQVAYLLSETNIERPI